MTQFNVTLTDSNDPESTRTIVMSEDEIRDTYPHWGGKADLVDRDGIQVHIAPMQLARK